MKRCDITKSQSENISFILISAKKNNGEFINLWAGTNFPKIRSLSANKLMAELKKEIG